MKTGGITESRNHSQPPPSRPSKLLSLNQLPSSQAHLNRHFQLQHATFEVLHVEKVPVSIARHQLASIGGTLVREKGALLAKLAKTQGTASPLCNLVSAFSSRHARKRLEIADAQYKSLQWKPPLALSLCTKCCAHVYVLNQYNNNNGEYNRWQPHQKRKVRSNGVSLHKMLCTCVCSKL
jgi:hypothetical protein